MRPNLRFTANLAGLSRRGASTVLVLAAVMTLAAGLARGEVPATIYQTTLQEPNQKTPEVSTEELRQILADQSALVFDARPSQEYAVSHIPGARNVSAKPGMPLSAYVSDVAEIGRLVGPDKSTPIVLYCNGPFCGKSKRLSAELVEVGYTHVRRYQLGIPLWRALGGLTEIEPEGLRYVLAGDRTAVFIDARDPEPFGRWRTITRGLSCLDRTGRKRRPWRRPLRRKPFTMWPISGAPSIPSSSRSPANRQTPRVTDPSKGRGASES
jgi:rhodanese-related sulfurtransferase